MKRLRSSCRDKGWPGTFQIVAKSTRVSGSAMHFEENSISCHGDGECFGGTDGRASAGAKRFVESTNQLAQTRISRFVPDGARSEIRRSGKNGRATAQKRTGNLPSSRDGTGFDDAVSMKKVGMHAAALSDQAQSIDRGAAVQRDQHR